MELYHHGIKGMRWGVRRTPEQLGHAKEKKKKGNNLNIPQKLTKAYYTVAKVMSMAVTAASVYALARSAMNGPVIQRWNPRPASELTRDTRRVRMGQKLIMEHWHNKVDPMLDFRQTL